MTKTTRYKDGQILSYAEYGDKRGYPILIQHGLIASIRDYHLFDALINAGARVICIARPGYGESSPYRMRNIAEWGELISVLVDELEIAQFDVLGMSSGAPYSYARFVEPTPQTLVPLMVYLHTALAPAPTPPPRNGHHGNYQRPTQEHFSASAYAHRAARSIRVNLWPV